MKLNRSTLAGLLVAMGIAATSGLASTALAEDGSATATATVAGGDSQQGQHHHHRHGRRQFRMGVCVGQNLAAAGVTLPAPTPGQPPKWTDAEKTAFKAARLTCKAEFKKPTSGTTPAPASVN